MYEIVKQILGIENKKYVVKEIVVATCEELAQAVTTAASLAKTRRTGKGVLPACFYVRPPLT